MPLQHLWSIALVTSLILPAGCDQGPALKPRLTAVSPAIVAAGQESVAVIQGEGFLPRLTWSVDDDTLEAHEDFGVRLGPTEGTGVHVADANWLTAMLPVPPDAAPGWYDLVVTSTTGATGGLERAVCVAERVDTELLYAHFVEDPGQEGVYTEIRLDAVSYDGQLGAPRPLRPEIAPMMYRGFVLSPDGSMLAFLRVVETGFDEYTVSLTVARLDDSATASVRWARTMAEGKLRGDTDSPVSLPVFSRDGEWMVWVEDGARLMRSRVPRARDEAVEAIPLAELEPDQQAFIVDPDIDPTSRWVLFTLNADPSNAFSGGSLVLVPLAGGETRPLLAAVGETWFGPAVFMPSGDRVLLLSNLLDMEVSTPFGMLQVSNLYTLNLRTGQLDAVMEPTGVVFLFRPEVSPDGRWAACLGHYLDMTYSGLDVFLVNLGTGAVFRTTADPGYDCGWGARDENNCPTVDMAAEFSPDSRTLLVTAAPTWWSGGPFFWTYYINRITLPPLDEEPAGGDVTLPPKYVERLPADTLGVAGFARIRQVLTCPEP